MTHAREMMKGSRTARRLLVAVSVLGVSASLAVPTAAQIAWDSPALIRPGMPSGFSVFLVNPAGGDLGALATLRHTAGSLGVGYRAALSDESGSNDLAFSAGVDVAGLLARGIEGSEIDVMWWSGGGLGVGSETLVTIPLGIVIGWSGSSSDVVFSPYGGVHLVLDFISGPGDSAHFDGVLDLGLDVVLPSGWMIRVGASVGDRDSVALGIKLPGGG